MYHSSVLSESGLCGYHEMIVTVSVIKQKRFTLLMMLVTIHRESTALGKFLSLHTASQDSDMGRELPEAQGHNVYERATYFLVFLFGEVALVCSGRSAHDLVIFLLA